MWLRAMPCSSSLPESPPNSENMEIIEPPYELKLSRRELIALGKGLNELELLQNKLPDEMNGYDLASQGYVSQLRYKIADILG
jgi:hypothetical protein